MAGRRRFGRTDRVNEALQRVIASTLSRLSDPRLELVTVTGVEVTPDFARADVYFVPGPDQDAAEAEAGLVSAGAQLRRAVGRVLRIRQVPELRFREDPAIVRGRRIDEILREVRSTDGRGREEPG